MISFFILLAALLFFFTVTWFVALKIKIAAIVDILWAASFGITAIYYWPLIAPHHLAPLPIIILVLILIWSFRLAIYLGFRVLGHGKKEDARYAALKEKWGEQASLKLFMFYQFQAILIFILSLVFPFVFSNATAHLLPQHIIGIALALIAIIGEAVSDEQLKQFKNNHPQSICDRGLWKYSRHPNYFFQWLAWCAWAVLATDLSYPVSLFTWAAPAIMYYLLRYVSGIPLTEKLMLKKYGSPYQSYLERTPPFFPTGLFKK